MKACMRTTCERARSWKAFRTISHENKSAALLWTWLLVRTVPYLGYAFSVNFSCEIPESPLSRSPSWKTTLLRQQSSYSTNLQSEIHEQYVRLWLFGITTTSKYQKCIALPSSVVLLEMHDNSNQFDLHSCNNYKINSYTLIFNYTTFVRSLFSIAISYRFWPAGCSVRTC